MRKVVVYTLLSVDGVGEAPENYFFDFDDEAYLVVSLLPRPDVFEKAMKRVARFCHAGAPA